jgi:hypothetical protein
MRYLSLTISGWDIGLTAAGGLEEFSYYTFLALKEQVFSPNQGLESFCFRL